MSSFDDPELLGLEAREAVVEAIRRAIERGVPIVYSEGGRIYREFADGHRVECERTDPSVTATLPALGFVDLAAAAPAQPETPGKRIVRIFAGPNGSGKSTIYEYIARRYESGYFINPDRINLELEASGRFSFANLPLQSGAEEVREALRTSSWGWEDAGAEMIARMTVHEGPEIAVAGGRLSYAAAIIADVVRHLMIREGRHFSIETVMSHPSKIEFMWEARRHGYTCYLYYVCTDSPTINVERVRTRVQQGGHDVPVAAIAARYHRSLRLLYPAIRLSYRAFLFDNSAKIGPADVRDAAKLLCLEFRNGEVIQRFVPEIPRWAIETPQ